MGGVSFSDGVTGVALGEKARVDASYENGPLVRESGCAAAGALRVAVGGNMGYPGRSVFQSQEGEA